MGRDQLGNLTSKSFQRSVWDAGAFTAGLTSVKGKQEMFATKLVQRDLVPLCEIRGCSRDTMATHISIIVLLPLPSPEGLCNETLTPGLDRFVTHFIVPTI